MKFFFDTEFIENGSTIDLISLGMVREDGKELYFQIDTCDFTKASDWVWRNVCPHLNHFDFQSRGRSCAKVGVDATLKGSRCHSGQVGKDTCHWRSRSEARELILEFVDPLKTPYHTPPEFWAYYADYDWVAFCQLFGRMIDLPRHFPMYCKDLKQLADEVGNPKFESPQNEHDALADAKWNLEFYRFLTKSRNSQQ